ncbi:dienelactone hydrolase family protein [Antrihabitans cavernicola]|uniref:Dienelactone hydrolase family protein n=1 Tax=Antrihabitans cavernicola TaxID=2495913 RepID=A0A5A7SBR8_9NOCA|nr:dienelactone hydrolase family protein [Spelaeibacter cavernicola]KAA0021925.1 dienelactone hydrolase family protein [Spelaeibacter cavernicola]
MTDIKLQTPNGEIDAVVEVPTGEGPWPGVVVVQDALGLGDDLRNILRRVAANDYIAIAPNLYSRGGMALCVKRVFSEMRAHRGRSVDDLLAGRKYLIDRDDCTGSLGVVGFCMGGGFALVLASKGFDASAPFYPSIPISHYDEVLGGACPIVASMGAKDVVTRDEGRALRKKLEDNGIEHDLKTYDAGHSFANDLPMQPLLRITGFGYDKDATEDAWRRVFAFFDAHVVAK